MSTIVVQAFITLDGVVQAGGGPEEDRDSGFEYGGWQNWYNAPEDRGASLRNGRAGLRRCCSAAGRTDLCWLLGCVGRERRGPAGRADQEVQPHPQVRCVAHAERGRLEEHAASRPRRAGCGGKLRAEPGGEIRVWGSTQLIRTLAEHDLVDEYRLCVYPLVLGAGKKLFSDGFALTKLTLAETRALPSGVLDHTGGPARLRSLPRAPPQGG